MKLKRSGLVSFLEAFDKDELGDFAWELYLKEGVVAFNEASGLNVDPHEGFLEYVEAKSNESDWRAQTWMVRSELRTIRR